MAFTKLIPYGNKMPHDLTTTTERQVQLWQELTMFRHMNGVHSIYAKEATADWIDQAKVYFLDAFKSNWKSGGLLYYYSFLNLAKAFLVTNRAVSSRTLKSTSIYHGLEAKPQNISRLVDFEINIHPPIARNKKNIFAYFYQKLTNEIWPYNNTISIKLSQVVPFCDEISHEIFHFYNIQKEAISLVSLYREDLNNMWLELLVPDSNIPVLQNNIGSSIGLITNFGAISQIDRSEWSAAYGFTNVNLFSHSLIRICQLPFDNSNRNQTYHTFLQNINSCFVGHILPLTTHDNSTDHFWNFIPKVTINATQLKWHPLLSNYLFAFVLSTILRYQPHLFDRDKKASFIGEAWCNQSAITSLRYFLMELSKQNLRIN